MHGPILDFVGCLYAILKLFYVSLENLLLRLNLFPHLGDKLRWSWRFSKTDAIGVSHFQSLFERILLAVDWKPLPLCIDAVYRSARKTSSHHPNIPIGRVFCAFRGVLFNNFEDFENFPNSEFWPAEADLGWLGYGRAHKIDCSKQMALTNRLLNPFCAINVALLE